MVKVSGSAVAGGSRCPASELLNVHGSPEQSSWEKEVLCLWQVPLFASDRGTHCWHQAVPILSCSQSPLCAAFSFSRVGGRCGQKTQVV